MKFTSPLGGKQHVGVPETATHDVYSLFYFRLVIYKRSYTRMYCIITNFRTELKPQVKVSYDMNSPDFTPHTMYD